MRALVRHTLVLGVILAIPILPFLIMGSQFDAWLREVTTEPLSPTTTALLIVGLLSTDIVLPVPSSVISTLSGSQLGWLWGTVTTWIGMNLGAGLGFGLARRFGRPWALRFSKQAELERVEEWSQAYAPWLLVVTRAIPILAEASVLAVGLHQLSWRRFWPAVALSNLGIAVAYAIFGDYAARHEWLAVALAISVAFPILTGLAAQRWLSTR